MKKLIAALVTAALLLALAPVVVYAVSTRVEVNNGNTISLAPGQVVTASATSGIPIDVKDIVTSAEGLAAFDFILNWNPAVVRVDRVRVALAAAFQGWSVTIGAINNTTGTVMLVGTTTGVDGVYSKADLTLAYLGITAVGNAGDTTTISLSITNLADNLMQEIIPRIAVNAPVVIAPVVIPQLLSIAVTPVNPSIVLGQTQQFTATGTYSDNSIANITGSVAWAIGNSAVATINSAGLASSVAQGTTNITAALGTVWGETTLTVTAPVLLSIVVTPVNPSIVAGQTQQFTATGAYSDNPVANLTALVIWTSSNTGVAAINSAGLASSVAQGNTNITATLGAISGYTTLTVTAAAPPPVPLAVATANATNITNSTATLNGILSSLGTVTPVSVSFQWGPVSGNYTFETTPVSMNATGPFSANLAGLTPVTSYYFRVKATAGNMTAYGAENSFTTLAPPNRVPTVSAVANSGPVNEGSSATVTVTATDPDGDTLSYEFDGNSDGIYEVGLQSGNSAVIGPFADNGNYTVGVRVSDGKGGSTTGSTTVVVNNVAPTLDAPMVSPASPGNLYPVSTPVTISGSFADPSTLDTYTLTINWDDATTTTANLPAGANPHLYSVAHTFPSSGVYTIRVTVTDDDLGTDTQTVMVVVYAPGDGFVTGGGWLTSPKGAYTADATLTGRANFGFVSKYEKGANVPTGQTEFQFQVAKFNFHSESYQWLVVAGPKAQYKGTGTVNGVSGYGFMLTATDGQRPGGGGADKFRIKVWNISDSSIVYDNKVGVSDDIDQADPQTIEGGSIVIHTK